MTAPRVWLFAKNGNKVAGIGKWYLQDGYCTRYIYIDNRKHRIQIHEHRRFMEWLLGRKLTSDELVHHRDGRKWNNCPFNLELTNRSDHMSEHGITWRYGRNNKQAAIKKGWLKEGDATCPR